MRKALWMVCAMIFLCSCQKGEEITLSGLNARHFQQEMEGQLTDLYVLRNKHGLEACVTNYGARLVSLMVPDINGKMEDVVCGFDSISDYIKYRQNFGATIGRYVGRILNSTFTLDSVTYHLEGGPNGHISHGGSPGFANSIWQAEQLTEAAVKMSLVSPDGENGFPGNLNVHLVYHLTDNNELELTYTADTDKATVLNPSHHSFFQISGDLTTTVKDQLLYIDSDSITPYDSLKCVTGQILPISGTPFDFRIPRRIGERIDEDDMQLNVTQGYDHNWVLNTRGDDTRPAVRLVDPKSGRIMEVFTTEPGVHVYTGNGLDGKLTGKKGIAYPRRAGVCFETQHYSDSPNKPQFPSTVLRPGETFRSRTVYKFSVE